MAKKIFLKFKAGKLRELLDEAFDSASSRRELIKQVKIPSGALSAYKKEIQLIPLSRAKKLAEFAGIDWSAVESNIVETHGFDWDKEETAFLEQNYLDMTAKEIAGEIGKTLHSVKGKRRALGLRKGPKYRWRKEKVIARFNELVKELGRTPTYDECLEVAPGMVSAIHKIQGKYSDFLKSLNLNIKMRYWTKEDCIAEFNKIREEIERIPTQDDLKACSGLFRAIIRRWNTYNSFLKKLGYTPNFELRWNKEECISEFKKIMEGRERVPAVEEMYKINHGLIAAIYKYHKSYPKFLRKLGYPFDYDDTWAEWEELVTKICKKLFKNIIVKPRLENNKMPDLVVLDNKQQFKKIIDAKLNAFAYSIYESINKYGNYCDNLEFWCAYGEHGLKTKRAKIRTLKNIKAMLEKRGETELLNELTRFES